MSALSNFQVCLLALAAAACAAEPSVQIPASRITEADVYATVLDTVYAAEGSAERAVQDSATAPVVLNLPGQDTSLANHIASRTRHLPGIKVDTQNDFVGRARFAIILPTQLPSRVRVDWVSPGMARAIGDRVSTFFDELPPSVTQLSPIGFSRDSSQALVYLSERCPGLCGHGEYILLERTNTGWQVVARSQDWIS